MAKTIRGINVVIGAETTGLGKALEDVNKKSKDIATELRKVNNALKFNPKDTELLAQKQKLLGDQVAVTREKLDKLRTAQEQVNEQFRRGEISEEQYRAFQREIIETESKLKHFEKQLKETGLTAEQVGQKFKDAGKKMTDIGKDLSKKVTAPIAATGTAALKMASDFTDSLAKVSTLADETQVSMSDLKSGILDISSATGIASTEISGAVYDALSAGVETADVLDYVEANVQLTKAGFTDMGVAIDATSTILNAYGEAAFDVTKIGDILVKTQDEGKISVDELGKNMGRVIPTASSLGVNLDQLGASYAILTAKGQNASIATTNLNSMLGEMGKTGSKSDKVLRELTGKSFKELVAEGKSVGDVLAVLNEYAEANNLSLADMFGSTTASAAALTLLSDGAEAFNEKAAIMNDSTGTMAENVEKLKTPSEEMRVALNKMKNAMIELGEVIIPVLSKAAEWITKVADKFAEMDDRTKKIIVIVAGLAAAIGPVLIVLGAMANGIGAIIGVASTLSGALPALGAVITALTGPIGIVVAAIAAFIAIGVALWKNWEDISAKATEIWTAIGEFFGQMLDSVSQAFSNAWNSITTATETAWEAIQAVTEAVWTVIREFITQVWEQIKAAFDTALSAVSDLVSSAWDVISAATDIAWSAIARALSATWERIRDMADSVWSSVTDIVKGAINGIIGFINKFIQAWNKIKMKVPTVSIPFVGTFGGWEISLPQIPEIPQLAAGGIVTKEMLAVIGEAGPEAVIPLRDLKKVMADLTGQAPGKGDIYQTVNVHSPEPLTPYETARQVKNASRQLAMEW